MSLPDVTISITDNALGLSAPATAQTASIGASSLGTVNTVYAFSDPTTVNSTLGVGPLAEEVVYKLVVGGGIVLAVPATHTASTPSAVTHTGTGASVMTVTTDTNAPYDAYEVVVTIVLGGTNPAAGTATYKYSLDNGRTQSAVYTMPTSGVIDLDVTGLNLTFSAASLVAGDTYVFTAAEPTISNADYTTAHTALTADPRFWKHVHLIGSKANITDTVTHAGVVQGLMAANVTAKRYTRAILDAASGTDAALIAAVTTLSADRVDIGAGFARITSPMTGWQFNRSVGWLEAARRHQVPRSEDSGAVATGPLAFVQSISRDERTTPGLDDARFTTARTIVGRTGFYLTQGRLFAPVGSDFSLIQYGEVMDLACQSGYDELIETLNAVVRVNPAGVSPPLVAGAIDERDAGKLEAKLLTRLRTDLIAPQLIVSGSVLINRQQNVLSTGIIKYKVRILPFGYSKFIEAEFGFENPAIQA